ncbi:MAG: glycosyltransferase family A protein, partial [Candidatus Aureabacteria bacterium]|nr:glycosyltransferase family A protein [Candidatus Auribacterota bacterium]
MNQSPATGKRFPGAAAPRVAVVVTCYNLGRYLDEAVNSVLAQTVQDFEIIVVDDGSTDAETNTLLSDYRRPKTTVFRVPHGDVSAARNYAIASASAPYIVALDADDLLEPTYLEKTIPILDKDPRVGIVSVWYRAFGSEEWEYTPESCTFEDILIENRICVSSLFRRSAWEQVGGYDPALSGYEDWEFWTAILEHGYACHIYKEFLFLYRTRPDSKVHRSNLPYECHKITHHIITKHAKSFQRYAVPVV